MTMNRIYGLLAAMLLALPGLAGAQETLMARVEKSGTLRVSRADGELVMIELNAHAPGWKHAPQADATAAATSLTDPTGVRLVGALPIPDAAGGALRFTQTVRQVAQGLQLSYDVAPTQALKLSGLQVSLLLPVARYASKQLVVNQLEGEPQGATFPAEQEGDRVSIWGGEGARLEVAAGTPDAVAIELRALADVGVQDLRKWEHPQFEIRFPAISEDGGREVTPADRFHLDLTVTFASPVKIVGP
jgi:hypothetical protein